jgi:hypothetical protein
MTEQTASSTALRGLIDTLEEIDRRWAGPEWNLHSAQDVADAHRALLHILEAGLVGMFESDPRAPDFRRIVTPSRKLTGYNSDAIYFDAPVAADCSYRVRGNLNGAVYFSLTIECGTEQGHMATRTDGVLNDTMIDIDESGNFEVFLGGEARPRNWLPLKPGASRVTTRHYFEDVDNAAADPLREPRLLIEVLDSPRGAAAPAPLSDATIAAGIERVTGFVRSRTLEMPPMANREQPPFVSLQPNQFPPPVLPGDFGLAAFDAHYSMAPYFLNEDEALVITGRWPVCRCAVFCLWNRFQQTYDYSHRTVSLNRAQTVLDDDGRFTMVLAHRDPGVPNWIDTEGRPLGLGFWRFMLVEGDVETPQARVVPFAELASPG